MCCAQLIACWHCLQQKTPASAQTVPFFAICFNDRCCRTFGHCGHYVLAGSVYLQQSDCGMSGAMQKAVVELMQFSFGSAG